jgi:hypothetical protein
MEERRRIQTSPTKTKISERNIITMTIVDLHKNAATLMAVDTGESQENALLPSGDFADQIRLIFESLHDAVKVKVAVHDDSSLAILVIVSPRH